MEKIIISCLKSFQKCFLFCLLGLLLSFSFEAKAAWTQESVTMTVGETRTLYLPSSVTTLNLRSVTFYSASIEYVDVLSYTNYSVTVKAKKAISTPVIVRCDYYYYYNNNGYIYQYSGAHDFKITVTGSGSGGSGGGSGGSGGGSGSGGSGGGPTSLYVTPTSMTLKVGETASITATQSGAIGGTYFTTDDSSIATVSSGQITGTFNNMTVATITAVGPGTVYVWAKNVNGLNAKCIVTVEQPTVPSEFTYNGIKYKKNGNGTTVSVASRQNQNKTGSISIPSKAYYSGVSLTVTSISELAFYECTGITSVTIPSTVTSIGQKAFYGCSGLASVSIGSSVKTIGANAFEMCSGLTSVTIPSSVTSIGSGVFSFCPGIMSIVVNSGNTRYDSRNSCNAIIEISTNTLIAGCKNTMIPNSVTAIGSYSFSGCSGLTSVSIGNSVTTIGGSAFSGCSGLTSICSGIENPGDVAMGSDVFDGVDIDNCILSVPTGTLGRYRAASQWNDFVNIEEETSAITMINVDDPKVMITPGHISVEGANEVLVYNMNGVMVGNSNETDVVPGVYIVVADGKTTKVLVK